MPSVECFHYHIFEVHFQVKTFLNSVIAALKANKENRMFSSLLTGWIDRLLPFEIKIFHSGGRTMGFVFNLSTHPDK